MMDKAKNLVSAGLNIPQWEIRDEASAENMGGWDSLAVMQLLVSLEEEYGIRISIKEIDSLKSVYGISRLIEKIQKSENGNS